MVFDIRTSVYEGPLDLLVSLIEKREIFINDISLSQVTDDYVRHLNALGKKDIHNMSDFVLVASTLMLIKSKSLLPSLVLSGEEEENIEELETRLSLYREIRRYAEYLRALKERGMSYGRGDMERHESVFAPSVDFKIHELLSNIRSLISRMPEKTKIPDEVRIQKIVSLEDTILRLKKRVQQSIQTNFREFAGGGIHERANIIVHFLALLELIKENMVHAYQDDTSGDIIIESESVSTPNYGA